MFGTILTILAGLGFALLVLATVFVLGMRAKSPLVLRPLFAISRRWLNPWQLRRAGRPGAYASIIRHRGRRTGRSYETPVGVVPMDDDFLVMLPYGSGTQWLRNVLAGGEATGSCRAAGDHPVPHCRRAILRLRSSVLAVVCRDAVPPAPSRPGLGHSRAAARCRSGRAGRRRLTVRCR
jgi:hypothetical protein